jgi:large subunit ribosomal protein L2
MGKRIISQNRGRGSPTYTAPSHKYKADLRYPKIDYGVMLKGKVIELLHDPARTSPIARVEFEDGHEDFVLACEGMHVGQEIQIGAGAEIKSGNVLPLSEIPEGTPIYNIEARPGDGGKFCRASGTYSMLVAHDGDRTVVQLPSGELKWLSSRCMAAIGVVAGGGRIDKPFVKAGKKYHKMKSKAAKWPRVRGVAMNAVDHPFGGGKHQHTGKSKTVSRNAPPGRKVGSIAARRTGKR